MPRSNRTLTQFAVDKLVAFHSGTLRDPDLETMGNTSVALHITPETTTFQVFLFDQCIFELDENHIMVRNGGFFDSKGRPSRTTRERLNGLLDICGELGIIPAGVRIFLADNGEKETAMVGKGDTAATLDERTPDRAIVRNPDQLLVF